MKFVPIDPQKGQQEIDEIISYTSPSYIFHDPKFKNIIGKTIDVHDLRQSKIYPSIDDVSIFKKIEYNTPFLITFTSGSTGKPKGVIHSFNNLVHSALSFNSKFNFDERNIFYHNLPMSYMAGILNLFILPLVSKSKIIIGKRFDISEIPYFWKIPKKYAANTFWFNPTILELLLKLDRGQEGVEYLHNSNVIGCVATAPLREETKNDFELKYGIKLFESYGLSETLFVSTNYPKNDKPNYVGKPLPDIQLSFSDDNEIVVDVPWMFLGYLNQNDDEVIDSKKYLSGDYGMLDGGNFLKITGRKKDLIIKGGINISPKRIEDFISKYNIFDEYAVLGFEDKFFSEKIICFFVPKKNILIESKKKNLNLDISKKLGHDYHIDEFFELNHIPKTTNGKTDKPKIRQIYHVIT